MNLIEEGMVITNAQGKQLTVSIVIPGVYGLLVRGYMERLEDDGEVYLIPELPPSDCEWDWYGWFCKSHAVLPNGLRVGCVEFRYIDPRDTIEEYDAEWERTCEAIRKEEQP